MYKKHRSFFYLSLAVGYFPCYGKTNQHPNVLIISVDDLNDWIAPLKGHPYSVTPNIDRLMKRGVVFKNCYCQAPISGPSRTSLLSGLYPSTSGVYYQIEDINLKKSSKAIEQTEFLPKYFELNGYKTMGAGKIFHNGDGAKVFQQYGGNFGIYGPYAEKRFKYDPKWFGKPTGTQTDWAPFPEDEKEMPDYKTVEWVTGQLKLNHEKPFFLVAGLVRPHVPWYVPQKWFDLISPEMATYPPFNPDDFDDIPEIAKKIAELPMMPDMKWVLQEGRWKEIIQAYMACVAFMDSNVGKLLDALDHSKYGENTIIVFYGDNGYELGEKGRFAKQSLWRTSTHVPLIIAGKNYSKNSYSTANVGLIDIYPTLLEICHLPPNLKNEGRSLIPLLKNPEDVWEFPVHSFYGSRNQSVYWKNLHYIRYSDGSEELYDLQKDKEEWYNLAKNMTYSEVLSDIRSKLTQNPVHNVPESKNKVNDYFINGLDEK